MVVVWEIKCEKILSRSSRPEHATFSIAAVNEIFLCKKTLYFSLQNELVYFFEGKKFAVIFEDTGIIGDQIT
jgi:hypothetical protein